MSHVYAFDALEVECIGYGIAGSPWQFGVKISLSATIWKSRGGRLISADRPCGIHTLTGVLVETERNTGVVLLRIVVNQGYRGHGAPEEYNEKFFVATP